MTYFTDYDKMNKLLRKGRVTLRKYLKSILNAMFVVIVFALTLWSVFRGEDIGQMVAYLKEADSLYLILGVISVIAFILGESVVIHYLMRTLGQKNRFTHCCLYSFIGFFYSCITPSASGGQPMQVVAMRKDDIPVAISTIVLAIVTVTYKLVLVILGLVILILRPAAVMQYLDGVEYIIYIGLALNVVFIAALLVLIFHPTLFRVCANKCMRLLNRIRPFRNPEKQEARVNRLIGQYEGAATFYRTNKHVIFRVFLITLLQRIVLFFITWLTYRAFHLGGERLWVILSLQAMISVAADMLPLPGGMGISENLFLRIFLPIFGENFILPAMIVSRGISYYSQLIISAIMTVASSFIIQGKKSK